MARFFVFCCGEFGFWTVTAAKVVIVRSRESGVKQGCVMSGFLILTGLRLDHEGDNGRQEKRNTLEFRNGAGGS